MPLVEQCHELNNKPANVRPLELTWADQADMERLAEALEGEPVRYIICSDLVYDPVSVYSYTQWIVELESFWEKA